MISPLQSYLISLNEIRDSGMAAKETSFYPPLEKLLNSVGNVLSPRVRCILNIKSRGAGIPDGGFFIKSQFKKATNTLPDIAGTLPARGVMEVKGTAEDVEKIAKSPQVKKYLERYGQVLVTNYRDFLIVDQGFDSRVRILERYSLANSDRAFWEAIRDSEKVAVFHEERLKGFLMRALLRGAPLRDPKDVAWFMASYAREAKARLELTTLPELKTIREALEQTLGIQFDGKKGDLFFKSTLIQTLFYGVFSAWVLYQSSNKGKSFDWRLSGWLLKVPFISALFHQITAPAQLNHLKLVEVLDWASDMLNRVETREFFKRFERDDAVQYFYEPFLEAFDPNLRKELGVWYTPKEVVKYMVGRVDHILKTELDIPLGLADSRVVILDPCCGTGAFLTEAAELIWSRLQEDGDAFAADDLKEALMHRIYGFELMPAPFVVAHLQLGLLLHKFGSQLDESKKERPGIFLTNSLTGWAPVPNPKGLSAFPELLEERNAANQVKQNKDILVILGNPPYNAFAGVASTLEESNIISVYKNGLRDKWGIKKYNLDELYARFFRLAERQITERTGKGVMCFVSNFSYLRDPSFVVMREHLLEGFDDVWVDNLNGDSRETGKKTPEGLPDPSIFSTTQNKEGIQKGTCIGLFVRKPNHKQAKSINFRHFWGADKREQLIEKLHIDSYEVVNADAENRFSFMPFASQIDYTKWPKLTDLCLEEPSNGLMEKRRGALFGIDKEALKDRMSRYFDSSITFEELSRSGHGLAVQAARYDPLSSRNKIIRFTPYSEDSIRPYMVRPFDRQWCYYTTIRPLWNEPRPTLGKQAWEGNSFLITRFKKSKDPEGSVFYLTDDLIDDHFLSPDAIAIPVLIREQKFDDNSLFAHLSETTFRANLSDYSKDYLNKLGVLDFDSNTQSAGMLWNHALSIGYSTEYQRDNADGLSHDFPRIPLPMDKDVLVQSATLGGNLANLLRLENSTPGVTIQLSSMMKSVAIIQFKNDEKLLYVKGWGYRTEDGKVMPGSGKVEVRDYRESEIQAFEANGFDVDRLNNTFGTKTCDLWLSDSVVIINVPERVYNYYIGGYQVIKKWLSYRDERVLNRELDKEEVRDLAGIIRRVLKLCSLEEELNLNYRTCKSLTIDDDEQLSALSRSI